MGAAAQAAARRRGFLLGTAALVTALYTFAALARLGELTAAADGLAGRGAVAAVEARAATEAFHAAAAAEVAAIDAAGSGAAAEDGGGAAAATPPPPPAKPPPAGKPPPAKPPPSAKAAAAPAKATPAPTKAVAGQAAPAKAAAALPAPAKAAAALPAPAKAASPAPAPRASAAAPASACAADVRPHTDFWGEALVWGSKNLVASVAECCAACAAYSPPATGDLAGLSCNVFVACLDAALCGAARGECWLKHLPHPGATGPSAAGPAVGWTTGVMPPPSGLSKTGAPLTPAARALLEAEPYHVVISAQGAATHWQARVHHYWYLKTRAACRAAGPCAMGGFTRILHEGAPDNLVDEIPTYVAQTLPPEIDHGGYVVLNRPWAFLQWAREALPGLPEKYVLMSEPDHLWLKPLPNLAAAAGGAPAAFPFFYIEPSKAENVPIVERLLGLEAGSMSRLDAEELAPIGSAPTLLSAADMAAVAPRWYELSLDVHRDAGATKAWGWVQEMYAFTIALYAAGVRGVGLHLKMMAQPPFDTDPDAPYLLHYTYGMDYKLTGEAMTGQIGEWRFDKRTYSGGPPPRALDPPPAGIQNPLVVKLIAAINEATAAIPGWDKYAASGGDEVTAWDGRLRAAGEPTQEEEERAKAAAA
jgi:hypothetical protein